MPQLGVGSSMVEQRPFKPLVAGSSPAQPTILRRTPNFLQPSTLQRVSDGPGVRSESTPACALAR